MDKNSLTTLLGLAFLSLGKMGSMSIGPFNESAKTAGSSDGLINFTVFVTYHAPYMSGRNMVYSSLLDSLRKVIKGYNNISKQLLDLGYDPFSEEGDYDDIEDLWTQYMDLVLENGYGMYTEVYGINPPVSPGLIFENVRFISGDDSIDLNVEGHIMSSIKEHAVSEGIDIEELEGLDFDELFFAQAIEDSSVDPYDIKYEILDEYAVNRELQIKLSINPQTSPKIHELQYVTIENTIKGLLQASLNWLCELHDIDDDAVTHGEGYKGRIVDVYIQSEIPKNRYPLSSIFNRTMRRF